MRWSPRVLLWLCFIVGVTIALGFGPGCSSQTGKIPEPCTESDQEPKITYWVKPKYPEEALAISIEGTVVIKVQVGLSGEVEKANIMTSANPLLDEVALDAALRCVFEPGVLIVRWPGLGWHCPSISKSVRNRQVAFS